MSCQYRKQIFDYSCGKEATHKATIYTGTKHEREYLFCDEHAKQHSGVCDLEELK